MNLLKETSKRLRRRFQAATKVGLDIGSHAIKLVAVERNSAGNCVTSARCLPVVSDRLAIFEGPLEHLLAEVVSESGISRGSECVFSLPSSLMSYQTLDCNEPLTAEEVSFHAQNAMMEILGNEIDRVTFDYWRNCNDRNSSIEGATGPLHLVWTFAEQADRLTRSLYKNGLRPKIIDAPATALARSAMQGSSTGRKLVIDIGCGEATFVWSDSGSAEYIRSRIQFDNVSASQSLATAYSVDIAVAEQLLKSYGISDKGDHAIAVANFQALESWLGQLLFEINRTCQYLHVRYGNSAIEELWLCGGAASIPGISQWITARTDLVARSASLPAKCRWIAAEPYTPVYAQAVSLALHGEPS